MMPAPGSWREHRAPIVFGLGAFAVLIGLEAWFRQYTNDQLHLQAWTSEFMMQTVSVVDLAEQPLRSLWYLHVQPPAFDAVRAVLAWLVVTVAPPPSPAALLDRVDAGLYLVWAAAYGCLAALMYAWLARITTRTTAAIATSVFLLHPATIKFASFLDSTFLSAVLITWLFASLAALKHNRPRGMLAVILATLACVLTRSLFQWPFILIVTVALALLKVPARRIVAFTLITGAFVALYSFKQWTLFGTTGTSTLSGYNLLSSIGRRPTDFSERVDEPSRPQDLAVSDAGVLTRRHKIDGRTNFNNARYLAVNRELSDQYVDLVASTPWSTLAREFARNTRLWLLPSASYVRDGAPHVIADTLPWRRAYDIVFSYPVLPLWLLVAVALSWRRAPDWRAHAAFALPFMYVVGVSIAAEQGENMRFKYFVEPVLFVFLVSSTMTLSRPR